MDIGFKEISALVSGGGVLAFAALVYYQLRLFGAELKAHRDEEIKTRDQIGKVLALLEKIVEKDREREIQAAVRDFVREEISGVHEQAHDGDVTPIEVSVMPRRKTPPIGIAKIKIPRPGSEGKGG